MIYSATSFLFPKVLPMIAISMFSKWMSKMNWAIMNNILRYLLYVASP